MKMKRKINACTLIVLGVIVLIVFGAFRYFYDKDRAAYRKQLFTAIEQNDLATVESVLDRYPTLLNEKRSGTGLSGLFSYMIGLPYTKPLSEAIIYSHNDIAKFLVDKGANVNDSQAPLLKAIDRENFEMAWYLIENGADITFTDAGVWNFSFLQGIVFNWIAHNDEVNAREALAMFRYGIENGAPQVPFTSKLVKDVYSLFGVAVCRNNYYIVEYYIEELSQDVNERITESGKTALICAIEHQAYNSCEVLLRHGADKSLTDADGKTALDYAIQLQDQILIDMLQD